MLCTCLSQLVLFQLILIGFVESKASDKMSCYQGSFEAN